MEGCQKVRGGVVSLLVDLQRRCHSGISANWNVSDHASPKLNALTDVLAITSLSSRLWMRQCGNGVHTDNSHLEEKRIALI
jgi:hypothetical protein